MARGVALGLAGGALVAVAIVAVLLFADGEDGETVRYTVPSESMSPTFAIGETINVDTEAYADTTPEVGDVVTFSPPQGALDGDRCRIRPAPKELCAQPTPARSDEIFVKRIVALPGDTLALDNGAPIVNGERLDGPWVARPCVSPAGCDFPKPITIPPEHYFMLGDKVGASDDSRFWGPVPLDWIQGRVDE